MEGRRRAVLAVLGLLACWALAATGCGEEPSERSPGFETPHPETAFAPVVLLAPAEPARPASAPWFIERSVLFFADDEGCSDREVAVGRTLRKRHTVDIDWIYHSVLGGENWAYYRNPFDATCDSRLDTRAYADQHTRPHDLVDRPAGVRQGEGFYLDLTDSERPGPPTLDDATSYFDLSDQGRTMRISYWMLFAMNKAGSRRGATHEGDWERVDVLLTRSANQRYAPRAVRLNAIDDQGAPGSRLSVPWRMTRRQDGTHPILVARRGSHELRPLGRATSCIGCERWRTWERTKPLLEQLWHGFGGAWGEAGPTGATTGPLGPHGFWAPDYRG